jgi:hypothetical protein
MRKTLVFVGLAVVFGVAGAALRPRVEGGGLLTRNPSEHPTDLPCGGSNCFQPEQPEQPEQPKQQAVFAQFLFQPNSPEMAQMTEDVLDRVARQVRNHHRVEISLLVGAGDIHVPFSGQANRRTIRTLFEELDGDRSQSGISPTPSSDQALTPGVKRLLERVKYSAEPQELHFYLVTQGTSNPAVISQIRAITTELAEHDLSQTQVYLIGLNPEHRVAFADAFNPIRQVVKSATANDGEWLPLVRSF